ncbi:Uma2 family endonuclease [Nocardia sp. NBC_01503]|uniref:Uma2 family endonuclease n=1 Tax=Nocardia sp. NBC_01503 TaxID=2975997 RepID=UPI002E7B165E|nr:Uma2 family endonuclease [Nocardia sp. NBC_01503]WTL35423.1 Uma2 family endonuclease [Nocardia sp. NBC_01503]
MYVPGSDRWTAADLDHLPENGLRYEVLNGQLVVNAVPTPSHQWLVSRLADMLDQALPVEHVTIQGVGILVGEDEPIPDLLIATGPIPWDDRGIPADQIVLAVEVVSRSTTVADRVVKPLLYAAAGIPTYWRLETSRFKGQLPGETLPVLFAFALGAAGEYELDRRVAGGAEATLKTPFDLTLDLATLLP